MFSSFFCFLLHTPQIFLRTSSWVKALLGMLPVHLKECEPNLMVFEPCLASSCGVLEQKILMKSSCTLRNANRPLWYSNPVCLASSCGVLEQKILMKSSCTLRNANRPLWYSNRDWRSGLSLNKISLKHKENLFC